MRYDPKLFMVTSFIKFKGTGQFSKVLKKILAELKNQGKVRLFGRGRGARWEIIIP